LQPFKLIFLSLVILGAVFFCSKGWHHVQKQKSKTSSFAVTEEKSFVIVIPSYNNSKYIEKNLSSVFSQNYTNYRVIYIDDQSSDDTLAKAKELLSQNDRKNKATLISNPDNRGALANIYNAAHTCMDHEIIILLDGDDYLAHEEVLNTLNKTYADPSTWITYGNYLDYPSYKQNPVFCKKLPSKIVKNHSFRKAPWIFSHLRTFYTGLFKQIKVEDLFYRGRFYSMGSDLALMLPMLEMASSHVKFIEDTLYLYNRENPISDHKINFSFQQQCNKNICSKTPYAPMKRLPNEQWARQEKADLLIFSQDHPLQLYALLESLQRYVMGINKISVLYCSSSIEMQSAYLDLKLRFPQIQFVEQKKDFKNLCTKLVFETTPPESRYILFALDTLIIKDVINLSKGIDALEQTKAYGLYLGHHKNLDYSAELERYQPLPPFCPLTGIPGNEIPIAWQFSVGRDDWASPNSFNFALYRKENLKKIFTQLEYDSPGTLLSEWGLSVPTEGIGLFYSTAKSIQLAPSQELSSKEILEKFTSGLKIDLNPFFQITSHSQQTEGNISYISRE